MEEWPLIRLTVAQFLDGLASERPTPGGGSVAALTGALAASLGHMVCGYTRGRKKFAEVEPAVREIGVRLQRAEKLLRAMVDEDAAAYGALSDAFKLEKSDAGRADAIRKAAGTAAVVPLTTAGVCRQVLTELSALRPIGNPNLVSDIDVAKHLAQAALQSAAINVRVNVPLVDDREAERLEAELTGLLLEDWGDDLCNESQ